MNATPSIPAVTPQHVLAYLRSNAEQVAALPEGAEIMSPCISVCRMDAASGLCEGCLRRLHEIGAWSELTELEKRHIWQRVKARASAA